MVTKVIPLSDAEAAALHDYADRSGAVEAEVLKEAAVRGLRELRLDQAFRIYQERGDSCEGAAIAGVPRAVFLDTIMDRGVVVLQGPSTLAQELDAIAKRLGDPRRDAAASKAGIAGE